jgi:hypothetical protein
MWLIFNGAIKTTVVMTNVETGAAGRVARRGDNGAMRTGAGSRERGETSSRFSVPMSRVYRRSDCCITTLLPV